MMPSFGNLAVQNLKDTALASLISLGDLAFRAEQIRNFTQDSTTVYTMILLMYFGMALVLTAIMRAARALGRPLARREELSAMLFGFHWDTAHGELAFALSILPMLLVGMLVTIEASIAGFAIALVLGLVFAVLKRVPLKIVS